MNRSLHAPLSQLALYGLGTVAGHTVNLLLLPFISRQLGPGRYGTFSMAFVLFTMLGMLLDLGVLQGMIKLYTSTDDGNGRRSVFTTSLILVAATATVICLPFIAFAARIAAFIFGSAAFAPHVIAVTVGAWSAVFFQFILAYHRSALSPLRHGIIALLRALFFGAFTIVLVLRMENSLAALFTGWLLPYPLFALCLLPFLVYRNRGRATAATARRLLAYSLPLVPSYLVLWLLTHTDLYLLRRLTAMEQVGYYTIAAQVCFLLAPVNTALQMGWLPFVLRTASRNPAGAPAQISRLWTVVFAAVGISALAVAAFAPELVRLLAAPSCAPAAAAVPLLSLSTVLYTSFLVFSAGIHVTGRTWVLPFITGAGAAANIGLNLFTIPRWGITGAAAATVVSNALIAAGTAFAAHRSWPVQYLNRLSAATGLILAAGAAVCAFLPSLTVTAVVVKTAVIAVCVLLLLRTGVAGRTPFIHLAATIRKMAP